MKEIEYYLNLLSNPHTVIIIVILKGEKCESVFECLLHIRVRDSICVYMVQGIEGIRHFRKCLGTSGNA